MIKNDDFDNNNGDKSVEIEEEYIEFQWKIEYRSVYYLEFVSVSLFLL